MSNEKQETGADIVSEMRRDCPERHMDGTRYHDCDWVYTKGTVKRLADRIEEAFSRLPLFTPEQLTAVAQQGCEIADLKRENARLRAALKPVLECKVLSAMTAETESGESEYCSNIIFNAQRIYNESEERL